MPLSVFLLSRIPSGLMLVWVGRHQDPPRPLGPRQVMASYDGSRSYLSLVRNWDGAWYQRIVEQGYPSHLPSADGVVQQNPWAFYPLYPASIRAVTATGMPFAVAASLVSLTCGAVAMCLLYRMLTPTCGRFAATMTVLALCTYASSVTFQAAYTESMALLLVLAALWALRNRRYGWVAIFSVMLALTRPIVLPVALVVAVHTLVRWRRRRVEPFPRREQLAAVGAAGCAALSFGVWPLTAAMATGRQDAYFVTQRAWESPDAHGWPSWLAVFVQGQDGPGMRVLVCAVAGTLAWAVARRWAGLWRLELRTWAWAYPLFVFCTTRPGSSVIRYAMLAIVVWWPFPEVGRTVTRPTARVALALVVAALGLCSQYFWLNWFWVVGPASVGYP